jgi:uncharacterized protein (TIGR03083 family)
VSVDAVPQADAVRVELDPTETLRAYARHRRRFASEVAALDAGELTAQSRCSKWSVADVLRHCIDVDDWMQRFWTGQAPPFTSFDPNTTPHEFVLAARAIPDADVRDRYVASSEHMASDVGDSGAERWGLPSVSPIGRVPWWLSALHVFYDSWLHERDALLPIGADVPVAPDESEAVLTYSLGLVGTLIREPTATTIGGVRVRAGSGQVVVAPTGTTMDDVAPIIDALSGRGSLEDALPGEDPAVVTSFGALARLFALGD